MLHLVLDLLIHYDESNMALEVAITKDPKFSQYPKLSKTPKKPLRLPAFLMIGLGVLILGYLGFSFVIGKPQNDSQEKEEIKEVLGITEGKEAATSFGGLLGTNQQTSKPRPEDGQPLAEVTNIPDPGLHITKSDLDSFGKILGLKDKENSLRNSEVLTEFTITIPALGIKDARVQTNIDGTSESTYQKALEEGIAHFAGSALPGEQGNVFLFGHSMLPILARGTYLSIFTDLPKLKKGDVVFVEYGNDSLRYLVEQTAVVDPKDVFVLRQPQNEELLTLMTCIPPGFGSDRFVAIAKRN